MGVQSHCIVRFVDLLRIYSDWRIPLPRLVQNLKTPSLDFSRLMDPSNISSTTLVYMFKICNLSKVAVSHWLFSQTNKQLASVFWTLGVLPHEFQIKSSSLTCTLSYLHVVILKVMSGVIPAYSTNRGVHCKHVYSMTAEPL